MRKDPAYVSRMGMRLLTRRAPKSIPGWSTGIRPRAQFAVRRIPAANALGAVRIDMPNGHAIYMHDTPSKNLFGSDTAFIRRVARASRTCAISPPGCWRTIRAGAGARSTRRSPPESAPTSGSPFGAGRLGLSHGLGRP